MTPLCTKYGNQLLIFQEISFFSTIIEHDQQDCDSIMKMYNASVLKIQCKRSEEVFPNIHTYL